MVRARLLYDKPGEGMDVRVVDAGDGLAAGLGSVGDRVPGPPAYQDGG